MDKQKVRFLGSPGQIYNIGKASFPHNVWKETTPVQLQHIIENENVRKQFDFDPPVNFSQLTADKTVEKKSSKKKKEDK